MKHTEETKKKISESMKDYHKSGVKRLKKKLRKITKGVWKELKD